VNLGWAVVGVAAFVTIVVDLFARPPHGGPWWHLVPAFDLVYGFVGCVAIVVMSKALGKWWVQRSETYYDEGRR
jgi:hypothetical protein